jgi:hypothetical protein
VVKTYGANLSLSLSFSQMNLITVLAPLGLLQHVWVLWELLVTGQDLIVVAATPTQAAEVVLLLSSLTLPLPHGGDVRPYMRCNDPELGVLATIAKKKRQIAAGAASGSTSSASYASASASGSASTHSSSTSASASASSSSSSSASSSSSTSTCPSSTSTSTSTSTSASTSSSTVGTSSMIVGVCEVEAVEQLSSFSAALFLAPAGMGGAGGGGGGGVGGGGGGVGVGGVGGGGVGVDAVQEACRGLRTRNAATLVHMQLDQKGTNAATTMGLLGKMRTDI